MTNGNSDNQERLYSVTTGERTYNTIYSLEHLIRVRSNWRDMTETQQVFEYRQGGWHEIDRSEMVQS